MAMLNRIGGRKVAAGIVILVCGIGSVLLKGDVPSGFLTLLLTMFSTFVAGNMVEHVAGAVKDQKAQAPVSIEDNSTNPELIEKLTKVDSDINNLNQRLGVIGEGIATLQQAISYVIKRAFPGDPGAR